MATKKKVYEDPLDIKIDQTRTGWANRTEDAVNQALNIATVNAQKGGNGWISNTMGAVNNAVKLPYNPNTPASVTKLPYTQGATPEVSLYKKSNTDNNKATTGPQAPASVTNNGQYSNLPTVNKIEYNPGTFQYDPYVEDAAVKAARKAKNKTDKPFQLSDEYNNLYDTYQELYGNRPGDFVYDKQSQMDDYFNQLLNRKDFSYDLNGDMLYQQYKDRYINQGQQAMMDTMAQAQAMTGGYGNSYAQQVGNQTYQGYLQQLNDKIPELYNLAMQTYQMEGEKLKDAYGMLVNDRNFAYGMNQDQLAQWNNDVNRAYNMMADQRNYERGSYDTDRSYNADNYFNLSNQDYGRYSDAANRALSIFQTNEDNKYKQAAFAANEDDRANQNEWNKVNFEFENKKFEESVRQWTEEFGFDKEKFQAQLDQWDKQYNLSLAEHNEAIRQFNEKMAYQKQNDAANLAEEQRQFNEKLAYQKASDEADRKLKTESNAKDITIKQLQEENAGLNDKVTGLQDQQALEKYANTPEVKEFISSVHTPDELKRQNGRTTINGKTAAFDSYEQYIDAVIEKWHKAGKITDNQALFLMNYYNVPD